MKHFLLLCKKYEEPRKELRKKVGGRNENGEPTRRSKINKGYTRIRGKKRKI